MSSLIKKIKTDQEYFPKRFGFDLQRNLNLFDEANLIG